MLKPTRAATSMYTSASVMGMPARFSSTLCNNAADQQVDPQRVALALGSKRGSVENHGYTAQHEMEATGSWVNV